MTDASVHISVNISVNKSVDILDLVSTTPSSAGRYIGQLWTDVSTDRSIGRYILGGSPRLHRCCTDASPKLYLHRVYWLISVDISVDTLVDTQPTLHQSINALVSVNYLPIHWSIHWPIVLSISRYMGRKYLVSLDILVDTSVEGIDNRIYYQSIYRSTYQ